MYLNLTQLYWREKLSLLFIVHTLNMQMTRQKYLCWYHFFPNTIKNIALVMLIFTYWKLTFKTELWFWNWILTFRMQRVFLSLAQYNIPFIKKIIVLRRTKNVVLKTILVMYIYQNVCKRNKHRKSRVIRLNQIHCRTCKLPIFGLIRNWKNFWFFPYSTYLPYFMCKLYIYNKSWLYFPYMSSNYWLLIQCWCFTTSHFLG